MVDTVLMATDIDSIGRIEIVAEQNKLWYIQKDGSINPNGIYVNQNYIEQLARGAVKDAAGQIVDTNISDENLGILNGLFMQIFPDLETFTKDAYRECLIRNKGSLSGALLDLYTELGGKNPAAAKKAIEENLWPQWANKVTGPYLRDHPDTLRGKNFIVTAKVSGTGATMEQLMEIVGPYSSRQTYYYMQGRSAEQMIGEDGTVPYVISSGEYSNHYNQAVKLAEGSGLISGEVDREAIIGLFAGKTENPSIIKFRSDFRAYLVRAIDKRRADVTNTAAEMGTATLDVYAFVEDEHASTRYAPHIIARIPTVQLGSTSSNQRG